MRRKNDEFYSVEEFSRTMRVLGEAAGYPPADNPSTGPEEDETQQHSSLDSLPDDTRIGFTDSMFLHAGLGISHTGMALGLEAPATLDQVHRRGEIFLLASLGAAAVMSAADVTGKLF